MQLHGDVQMHIKYSTEYVKTFQRICQKRVRRFQSSGTRTQANTCDMTTFYAAKYACALLHQSEPMASFATAQLFTLLLSGLGNEVWLNLNVSTGPALDPVLEGRY